MLSGSAISGEQQATVSVGLACTADFDMDEY
jgi:hypothetical protein